MILLTGSPGLYASCNNYNSYHKGQNIQFSSRAGGTKILLARLVLLLLLAPPAMLRILVMCMYDI